MSQLQVTGEAKIRDIQGPVVANSGVITALDGAASQYVRGDGTLADFPTSTGGGSSVSYYLNSSVSQGTIGGVAYRELSKEPIIGAGTDIAISSNGYVASYLTDANDPDVLSIPGGNFNCEFYFSVNNNTGNPFFYAELYKYDGTTFTLLGSSVGVPEYINQGTIIAPYYFAIPVPTSALAVTDRLAIRIYVNVDGRTVTLHTENSHLCQVVTTLSKGMVSLNNLTDQSQFLATGTSGTDFNIVSSGDTHTFNIPSASSANRGLITTGNQTIAGNKVFLAGVNVDNLQVVNATLLNHQTGLTPTLVGTTAIGGSANGLFFNVNDNGRIQEFIFDSTGDRDYTFPAASGTIALISNLSSYVPYTGATADVDLGLFSIISNRVSAIGDNSTYGGTLSIKQNNVRSLLGTGYTELFGKTNILGISFGVGSIANLSNSVLTAERTFTLPDLSGTLALLEGAQTFTGKKTFSNGVNITGDVILSGGTGYGGGIRYVQGIIQAYGSNETTTEFPDANSIKYYVGQGSGNYKNFVFDVSNVTLNATRTYNLPDASGTLAILEAGTQTFTGTVNVLGSLGTKFGISIEKGNTPSPLSLNDIFIYASSGATNIINFANSSYRTSFSFPTSNQTFTYPAASGTVALTSDLSGYVPYTGATSSVNLGAFDLTSRLLFSNGSGTASGIIGLKIGNTVQATSGYGTIGAASGQQFVFNSFVSGSYNVTAYFNFSGLSNDVVRSFTFPNADGTLALTSNLSAYLPLAGGTLTGALSGTSATFGGLLTINVPTDNTTVGIFHAGGGTANRGLKISTFVATNDNAGVTLDAQTSTGVLAFATAGAEKARITNGGYLKASNNGSYLGSTGAYHELRQSAQSTASVVISASNASFDNNVLAIGSTRASSSAFNLIAAYANDFNDLKFVVRGDGAATFTQSNGAQIRLLNYGGSSAKIQGSSGTLAIDGNTATTLEVNSSEVLRATSGGNVGIATSSPATKLDVSGTIRSISQTDPTSGVGMELFYRAADTSSYIQSYDRSTDTWKDIRIFGNNILFGANGSERMRITSGGQVQIKQGSDGFGDGLRWINTFNNRWTFVVGGDHNLYIGFNEATRGIFNSSTGVYTAQSDVNKKKDFEDSTIGLNAILGLKPTLYRMKTDETESSKELGFIAQEVKEFIPQAYVESGENESKFIGLNFNAIVAALVKSVQEQQAQIEELKELIKNK